MSFRSRHDSRRRGSMNKLTNIQKIAANNFGPPQSEFLKCAGFRKIKFVFYLETDFFEVWKVIRRLLRVWWATVCPQAVVWMPRFLKVENIEKWFFIPFENLFGIERRTTMWLLLVLLLKQMFSFSFKK